MFVSLSPSPVDWWCRYQDQSTEGSEAGSPPSLHPSGTVNTKIERVNNKVKSLSQKYAQWQREKHCIP